MVMILLVTDGPSVMVPIVMTKMMVMIMMMIPDRPSRSRCKCCTKKEGEEKEDENVCLGHFWLSDNTLEQVTKITVILLERY